MPDVSTRRNPTARDTARAAPRQSGALALGFLVPAAAVIQIERDDEIISQGTPAEHCFQVLTGCVRTVKLLADGRRQVGEFLFAGDVFGWDASSEHEFGAEAVTATTLRRFRNTVIEERADSDAEFSRRLLRYVTDQLARVRTRLVVLGRKTAAERIACFLLEMSERLTSSEDEIIALPMSRADMADYLGLTIETVCRGLTELRRQGAIDVDRSRIALIDGNALRLAASDRLH